MAALMMVNPAKRRRAKKRPAKATGTAKKRTRHTRRANPLPRALSTQRRTRRTRRSRNPVSTAGVMGMLKPAAIEAGGAILLDLVMGYLPVSSIMSSATPGTTTYGVIKLAVAMGIGLVAEKAGKGGTGASLARGGMTVTLHDMIKGLIASGAPSIKLGEAIPIQRMQGMAPRALNGMGQSMQLAGRNNVTPLATSGLRPTAPTAHGF